MLKRPVHEANIRIAGFSLGYITLRELVSVNNVHCFPIFGIEEGHNILWTINFSSYGDCSI